ncbi:uncharacterized protein LOC100841013 isoform X1 [Brachypodium distachyon]|uniref:SPOROCYTELESS-like EAR-containing protein 2 n=1 Tax=Brachypodium distachyon TaxID=15368 RepID=A0A2K2D795_BRADI|nr:uncharacterized protein LOC100841013 isoform X1 [Brachypodium distachyon]PNT70152.1 hypothetical protein BRADI_2g06832v3 [Brachypodium distachyon]|eukprot:XP_014754834.1 uncharacterized protein LOC100841013 isoform X1 [Brachypodium distachyon]
MVQEHGNNQHHLQQQLAKYGGGGVAGSTATGVARASRKNKPKKIPQRGLGVAQLEKLRIEEQKKMAAAGPATPSSHAALNGHLPPPAPPLSALSRPPGHADGGGFPPVLWSPVDPAKHPYKRSLCPQPPLPMVSTGLSLTAPSSHPMEPPSNQMYSSSSSRSGTATAAAEEERETAGGDRSWPIMFEGMTAFRTASKAFLPPHPAPPFTAVRTATDSGLADVIPDLGRFEFRATNLFSASAYGSYSDWTSSEFAHSKSSSSKETGRGRDPALLTLSSQPPHLIKQPHVVPSMHIPEYNGFSASTSVMPSQQGSTSAASSSSQPFYSFLPVGPVRLERAPSECKTDMSEGGVDLELKLWKG